MKYMRKLQMQSIMKAWILLLVYAGSVHANADLTRLDTWKGEGIKKVAIAFDDGLRFVAAVQPRKISWARIYGASN